VLSYGVGITWPAGHAGQQLPVRAYEQETVSGGRHRYTVAIGIDANGMLWAAVVRLVIQNGQSMLSLLSRKLIAKWSRGADRQTVLADADLRLSRSALEWSQIGGVGRRSVTGVGADT
jgi:hypothetical protein